MDDYINLSFINYIRDTTIEAMGRCIAPYGGRVKKLLDKTIVEN